MSKRRIDDEEPGTSQSFMRLRSNRIVVHQETSQKEKSDDKVCIFKIYHWIYVKKKKKKN